MPRGVQSLHVSRHSMNDANPLPRIREGVLHCRIALSGCGGPIALIPIAFIPLFSRPERRNLDLHEEAE